MKSIFLSTLVFVVTCFSSYAQQTVELWAKANTEVTDDGGENATNEKPIHMDWYSINSCEGYDLYMGLDSAHRCADEMVWLNENTYIDSKWLTLEDYYCLWDTKSVAPFEMDLKKFKDTVDIHLFDTLKHNWHAPLLNTETNSKYGLRRSRWHHGIDLDLEIGDTIYATFDGVVRIAKYNYRGYGYYVMLRHENGLETLYGHLKKYWVKPGDEVKAGEVIGLGGNSGHSTGPHLHFEVRYKGQAFDPTRIFDFDTDSIKGSDYAITRDTYSERYDYMKAVYHRVRSGDCLSKIAVRHGTYINRICRLNGISRNSTLRIGQVLRVR